MSGQSGGQRLSISTLNEQLTCKLCGGYFIDATTIIECLHSFCKSCIVKYLENNKFCPVCDTQVHKNKPLLNLRPDPTLQDIVYKLIPGCYQNEMRYRKEFYAKHPEEKSNVESPEARGEPVESYIYSPDESLSLSLEYHNPEPTDETKNDKDVDTKHLPRRYLRCPAAVTIFHLQKLIRAKYGLSEAHRVDIMYEETPLSASYTLMDIMYIYHWKRKVPLHLSYRIFESASKRLKLSEDNDEFKQSLSNSNMQLESKDDEQSVKREWKEVQLKISETGVMSVTDISNLETKKSTKVKEINQHSGLDQAASNSYNVNKAVEMSEDKEPVKTCTASSKNKKVQQEVSVKKNEVLQEVKLSTESSGSSSTLQSNSKSEEMEVKLIDQRDISNELMKTDSEKCESNCSNVSSDSVQVLSASDSSQAATPPKTQQSPEKIKTEPASILEKCPEPKQNLTNNNVVKSDVKVDMNIKQSTKSNDVKATPTAGAKINALSAKLQFQPKVGQVNNTYSKKSITMDKKLSPPPPVKATDTKIQKTSPKSEVKPSLEAANSKLTTDSNDSKVVVSSTSCSSTSLVSSGPQGSLLGVSSAAATYVTAPSVTLDTYSASTNLHHHHQHQQHNNAFKSLSAPSAESLASIGLHVSTTAPSQVNLNSWMAERNAARNNSPKNSPGKAASPDQQVRSLSGMPQIGKDIICTTTASGPACSMGRFNIQKPSMSIYSIPTSLKNNVNTSAAHSYSSASTKQPSSKSGFDVASMYAMPPCPDAIPISLMKPNARKDALSKGTAVNEICAKISNAVSGSKINDICAKIGENSKEKSKIEAAQRSKPDVPDLLKISKKTPTTSASEPSPAKHIPNIPNVPFYTPSNSQSMQLGSEAKDSAKRLSSTIAPTQTAIMSPHMHRLPAQKKHSQAVGYTTLRDPPKPWNPTLSENNYVSVKKHAKEMQNQSQASYGLNDGSGTAKPKAKMFKNKNMPRFLGNPASGVKPIYGMANEQSKEKEQQSGTKSGPSMSMMKIDPKTLSPIVSSSGPAIVSPPPPYSPTAARGYQGSHYSRELCRNSGAGPPISPRNSPNMFSTGPFIPLQTPNPNPQLIYAERKISPRHVHSHFPPGSPDAGRFSNPLIRSPIDISPSSAFHNSLPPSINIYQRSSYMPQLQSSSVGQPPTVQRIPPSSHSSPSPASSVSKSIKTTSPSVSLSSSSSVAASMIDSVTMQLAKGLAQREASAFDLTRVDSLKSASDVATSASPSSAHCAIKTGDAAAKIKLSPSPSKESPPGKLNTDVVKTSDLDCKPSATTPTKEPDKKERSLAKVNGGITITKASSEKPKDVSPAPQQQSKPEKLAENKTGMSAPDSKSTQSSSPAKSMIGKGASEETPADKAEAKQPTSVQQKQEVDAVDSGKTTDSPLQSKKVAEVQKGTAES